MAKEQLNIDTQKAVKAIEKLKNEIKKATSAADQLEEEIEKVGGAAGKSAKEVGEIKKGLKQGFADSLRSIGGMTKGLGGVGGSLGKLSGLATGFGVAMAAAFAVESVVEFGMWVADTEEKFTKLGLEVKRFSGLTGAALNDATAQAEALAQVFGVDVNKVLDDANALSKNMGISFVEALDEIQRGLAAGGGEELLAQLNQYPAVLKNVGISATQATDIMIGAFQRGIPSDKAIDAIKEVDLALKEMTKAQTDALEMAFGERFAADLATGLATGATSTAEAVQMIDKEANRVGLSLQQMQVLTADLFKGAGEDAGGAAAVMELFKDVMNGTIQTTDELSDKQNKQVAIQQEWAEEQIRLAENFKGVGEAISNFFTELSTSLLSGFNYLFEGIVATERFLDGIFHPAMAAAHDLEDAFVATSEAVGDIKAAPVEELEKAIATLAEETKEAEAEAEALKNSFFQNADAIAGIDGVIAKQKELAKTIENEIKLREQQRNAEQLAVIAANDQVLATVTKFQQAGVSFTKFTDKQRAALRSLGDSYESDFIANVQSGALTMEEAIQDVADTAQIVAGKAASETNTLLNLVFADAQKLLTAEQEAAAKASEKAAEQRRAAMAKTRADAEAVAAQLAALADQAEAAATSPIAAIEQKYDAMLMTLKEQIAKAGDALASEDAGTLIQDLLRKRTEAIKAEYAKQAEAQREAARVSLDETVAALDQVQQAEINGLTEQLIAKEITEDEFRQRKLQKELEFLQLQKQLQEAAGESTVQTQAAINDAVLALQSELSEQTVENTTKTVDDINAELSTVSSTVGSIASSLGSIFDAFSVDDEASKQIALFGDLAQKAIQAAIAVGTLRAAETPFPANLVALASILAGVTSAVGAIRGVAKFAKGTPFVQGPGTGTSDSVPAMLSRGERVIPAKLNRDRFAVYNALENTKLSNDELLERLNGMPTVNVTTNSGEVVEAIKGIPQTSISVDESGFSTRIIRKQGAYTYTKNRYV